MEYILSVLKDESRIDELIELFKTGLGETTREYWKWRLFTPNGAVTPEVIVAEDDSSRIVGMSTVYTNIYGNNKYKAVFFCDWVIHPNCRGTGLMGKIYKYIYDLYGSKGYDFMMTFPNDNSAPIFKKYGFEEKSIYCWETQKKLVHLSNYCSDCEKYGYKFIFSDKCAFDINIQNDRRLYRTKAFMKWKFDDNPDTKFKWLTVFKDDETVGYFVYTLTHGRFRTAVNVYDADFEKLLPEAAKYALALLKKQGNFVSILCDFSGEKMNLLSESGLSQAQSPTQWFTMPFEGRLCPDNLEVTRIDIDF